MRRAISGLGQRVGHGHARRQALGAGACDLRAGSGHRKVGVDEASHKRYIGTMKTATIPPIRIESAFREEIEQSLETGETMASLVENAVRTEVSRRRDQSEFVRRGLAAIARSEAAGDWIPAETVIAKLEAKVTAARERQKKHRQ